MDSYMDFEAPFSSLFFVSPRLADSAAPAAFCCALDFAGMVGSLRLAPKIERSTYAFVPGSFYDDAGHRTKWRNRLLCSAVLQHTHLCRSKRMTTEQERDFPDRPDEARGVRIPEESSSQEAEDVLDPEGYDESQRAEILEAEGRGATNGVIQTGLFPDDGEGDAAADEVEVDADETNRRGAWR